jgi:integrase
MTTRKELPPGVDRIASGHYRARASCGGRRVSRTFSSPEAASRWRLDALDALRAGREVPGAARRPTSPPVAPLTVLDACRALGQGIEAGTVRNRNGQPFKPSVSRRMEGALRLHVIPRIGALPVPAVTRRDVQRLVDALAAEKGHETAKKALVALSVALRVAERDGVIDRNPAHAISVPRDGTPESPIRLITPEEADALLEAARADDEGRSRSLIAPLLGLALGAGLRSGEVLALEWGPEGLDLDAEVVRVRWSADRVRSAGGHFAIVAPKSRAAVRDVPLDPADVPLLRRHRLATGRPADGALVFSGRGGRVLDPSGVVRSAWLRVRDAARVGDEPLLAPQPRFHDTRHAWAVAMLRSGIAPAAVARLGGWADVGLVHRRYGRHALPDELEGAGRALGAWREARRRGHAVVTGG